MYELRSVYAEHISKEDLEELLKGCPNISFYAFIEHDKDTNELGTLKKPHFHIGIEWSASTHKSVVGEITKGLGTLNLSPKDIKQVKNKTKFMRYLRHLDDCNKHQYELAEVCSSDIEEYSEMCEIEGLKGSKEIEIMLDQMIAYVDQHDGIVTRKELAQFCVAHQQAKYWVQHSRGMMDLLVTLGYSII